MLFVKRLFFVVFKEFVAKFAEWLHEAKCKPSKDDYSSGGNGKEHVVSCQR